MCGKENIWESAHFLPTILSAPKGEFVIYLDFSLELPPKVLWIPGHEKEQAALQTYKSQNRCQRCSGGRCCPASPFLRTRLGKGWTQRAEILPQNSQTCPDLMGGTVRGFFCCPTMSPCCGSPPVRERHLCLNFHGESSYLMGSIFFV